MYSFDNYNCCVYDARDYVSLIFLCRCLRSQVTRPILKSLIIKLVENFVHI